MPKLDLPVMSAPVVDQAGILSAELTQKLNGLLRRVHDRDIAQLQILTLKSLNGIPIEQAGIQIVDQWKLGSKPKDNGVLFLIVPTEHKMRIEVGRGLEGDLPDAIAKRIVADVVAPSFKQGLFDEGVAAGVIEILKRADPESIGAQKTPEEQPEERKKGLPIGVIILFLFVIFIRLVFGRGFYGGGFGGGFGGGGFGGGGSGGWSGGGGSFNGGGASGDW